MSKNCIFVSLVLLFITVTVFSQQLNGQVDYEEDEINFCATIQQIQACSLTSAGKEDCATENLCIPENMNQIYSSSLLDTDFSGTIIFGLPTEDCSGGINGGGREMIL